jgi:predicted tellurium resistance membrane protein TerC
MNSVLLIIGGLFLIYKSITELHESVVELPDDHPEKKIKVKSTFFGAVVQIAVVDFVFSFDSIITAIAISKNLFVIIIAVVISMIVMLFSSDYVSRVINKYPSLKNYGFSLYFYGWSDIVGGWISFSYF